MALRSLAAAASLALLGGLPGCAPEPPPATAPQAPETAPPPAAAAPQEAPGGALPPVHASRSGEERKAIEAARRRGQPAVRGAAPGDGAGHAAGVATLTRDERLAARDDPATRLRLDDFPAPSDLREAPPDEAPGAAPVAEVAPATVAGPGEVPAPDEEVPAPDEEVPAPNEEVPAEQPSAPAEAAPDELDDELRPGVRLTRGGEDIRLVDLAIAVDIKDRVPEGVSNRFPEMPRMFMCFTVYDNRVEGTTVTHVWRRDGRVVSKVELEVGRSPKWRTWSRQRVKPDWTGEWSCEVLAPGDVRLGTATFTAGRG